MIFFILFLVGIFGMFYLLGDVLSRFGNTPTLAQKEKYDRYINSEDWNMRKVNFFATQERVCRGCGSYQNIHVHHMTYERIGVERDEDLIALCRECHELYHSLYPRPSVSTTNDWLIKRRIAVQGAYLVKKHFELLRASCKKEVDMMRTGHRYKDSTWTEMDYTLYLMSEIVRNFVQVVAEQENPDLSSSEIDNLLRDPLYEWMYEHLMQYWRPTLLKLLLK